MRNRIKDRTPFKVVIEKGVEDGKTVPEKVHGPVLTDTTLVRFTY